MTIWNITAETLPTIPDKDDCGFSCDFVWVQGARNGSASVRPYLYRRWRYAKTEKGRAPRFEDTSGRIASPPDVWAYLAKAPASEASA